MWHPIFMLFVGSGFSIGQGGPSWKDLRDLAVSELTGHLAKSGRDTVWEQMAELAVKTAKIAPEFDSRGIRNKPEFATWVIGESFGGTRQLASFLERHLLSKPTLLHAITVEHVLGAEGIILTTEFDGLFAQTIRQLYPRTGYALEKVSPVRDQTKSPICESPRSVRLHKCFGKEAIVELHGSVCDPDTLICYPDQVASWRNNEAAERVVRLLEKTDVAVFWGCGGNDEDIVQLFGRVASCRGAFSRTLVINKAKNEPHLLGNLRDSPLIGDIEFIPCDGLSAGETWRLIDGFVR
jgi:hypothetical protein